LDEAEERHLARVWLHETLGAFSSKPLAMCLIGSFGEIGECVKTLISDVEKEATGVLAPAQ